MSFISAAVLLFFVMEPIGNIPLFVAVLKDVPEAARPRIVFREHLIALVVLVFFLFAGRLLLELFHIEGPALSLAGGIILFLIALKMIFPRNEGLFGADPEGEPFIVPLATPFLAGPSTITTVMMLMTREPARWPEWLGALSLAWLASLLILLPGTAISRALGHRTLAALQRLMGMLLTALATQMFLSGLREFMDHT
jgi:MarC family membrane protein